MFTLNISEPFQVIFNYLKIKGIALILIHIILVCYISICHQYSDLTFTLLPFMVFMLFKLFDIVFVDSNSKAAQLSLYTSSSFISLIVIFVLEINKSKETDSLLRSQYLFEFFTYAIIILTITLIPLIYTYIYFKSIIFFETKKRIRIFLTQLVRTFTLITVIGLILWLIVSILKLFDTKINYSKLMDYTFYSTFLTYLIITITKRIINASKFRKNIKLIKSNMSRVAIFDLYQKTAPSHRPNLLTLFKLHVKTVTGEWPEKKIFTNLQDENITKLAQLDEKWLGLDR